MKNKNFYYLVAVFLLLTRYELYAQCNSAFFEAGTPSMTSDVTITSECQQYGNALEGILTSNDVNRTLTIGNGTDVVEVVLDYPTLTLTGETNNGVYINGVTLTIKNNATLIVPNDLLLTNSSSINVENGGTLIIGNDLLTEGGELTPEESVGVTINVADGGEVHVGNNAVLNYSGGYLGTLPNPNMFVSGLVTQFDPATADTSGLESLLSLIQVINFFAGGALDWLEDIVQNWIDSLENATGGFDITLPGSNPGSPNPFDTGVVITIPTTASASDFFTNTSTSENIFTTSELDLLDIENEISLANKKIQIQSSILDISLGEISQDETNISSLLALKNVLSQMTWNLHGSVATSMTAYHNNMATEAQKTELTNYFAQDIKITISVVDKDAASVNRVSMMMTDHQQEVTIIHSNIPDDLPVELTYFNASIENEEVLLKWETATEINASHFVVQRSTDKTNWVSLGEVEAAGNSNVSISYEFSDISPLTQAYYRLHQYDFDGQNEIFGPVQVNFNANALSGFDVVLMPNAISNGEDLRTSLTGLVENSSILVKLFDGNGRELFVKEIGTSSNSLFKEIDVPNNLSTGVYYMVFQNGSEVKRKRLVIK
ncbi:T9SS type A sorting domain-containing protein [Flammeovirga yaeyamensis]|uniref:T9SS type A sorting domain-containing protein n=1 Tax=Flammeovirga yaeyamensis TaxID=367791 RepID=A0AAX1N9J4_9BACT|nr:T9SS type A sorting domain-containing protein [Flammeovirga yaeyamensis]MBB3700340.1 hypothetical protein [Flammeovirga yaeyamensis]NMF37034.1 T9SS type A sorting domain-containing protein [Flammeovirga yaeyamensis]QWG02423.1 T9SS type A sorting domain-containing protein [Flammeovirga yaeyamensis]